MNNITQILILILFAFVTGYGVFRVLLFLLPRRLQKENRHHKERILLEKRGKIDQLKGEAQRKSMQRLELESEDFNEQLKNRMEDLTVAEEELNSQEQSIVAEEQRLHKLEKELGWKNQRLQHLVGKYNQHKTEHQSLIISLRKNLEQVSHIESENLKRQLIEKRIESRQIEAQKILKELDEQINLSEKRLAGRCLAAALSRYAPEFAWPKPINLVEINDPKTFGVLETNSTKLIEDLRALAEDVTIELLKKDEETQPAIKLVGGYGIFREAARLTLEELIPKGPPYWTKLPAVYEKHRRTLEHQALKLGREAVQSLRVAPLHEEILKMIGSLNWRTSYRQNQYLHSLEVARLAGIVASELNVDPNKAKRVGLLHDIGKSIDYRIEGSHAVISGDYADRFGESREICDTVMSHHADLIVETPLAYVLRAADTLSGARPGARVNLEEGYQIRLTAIEDAVRKFPGIQKIAIMNGGREVHIDVNREVIKEQDLQDLSAAIARKIEEDVAYPGQIKVLITRRFEATAVA